jgi:hypothetical protein
MLEFNISFVIYLVVATYVAGCFNFLYGCVAFITVFLLWIIFSIQRIGKQLKRGDNINNVLDSFN